jgi:antitoxin (DNA-binding transcriptional repressor) of toxin-antitoxin stability system
VPTVRRFTRVGCADTLAKISFVTVQVNMHEAKTRLSQLVELVERGERVLIARNGEPVAELVLHVPKAGKRKGGQLKGKIWMSPDFDDPLPEFEPYMR